MYHIKVYVIYIDILNLSLRVERLWKHFIHPHFYKILECLSSKLTILEDRVTVWTRLSSSDQQEHLVEYPHRDYKR